MTSITMGVHEKTYEVPGRKVQVVVDLDDIGEN